MDLKFAYKYSRMLENATGIEACTGIENAEARVKKPSCKEVL